MKRLLFTGLLYASTGVVCAFGAQDPSQDLSFAKDLKPSAAQDLSTSNAAPKILQGGC